MRQLAHMRFQTSPPPAGAAYSLLRGAEEEGAEEMEDKGLVVEYDKDKGLENARQLQKWISMELRGGIMASKLLWNLSNGPIGHSSNALSQISPATMPSRTPILSAA
jgi:hypothetical protein